MGPTFIKILKLWCSLRFQNVPVGIIGVQETAKFGGLSRSADLYYNKFHNVSKADIRVSTEITLFIALLIIAITPWFYLQKMEYLVKVY